MVDNQITYEERYDDEEYETTTFYFIADKSLLMDLTGNKYPEANGMTISVECPTNCIDSSTASVMISPNKETEDGYSDYDWNDVSFSYDLLNELLAMVPA